MRVQHRNISWFYIFKRTSELCWSIHQAIMKLLFYFILAVTKERKEVFHGLWIIYLASVIVFHNLINACVHCSMRLLLPLSCMLANACWNSNLTTNSEVLSPRMPIMVWHGILWHGILVVNKCHFYWCCRCLRMPKSLIEICGFLQKGEKMVVLWWIPFLWTFVLHTETFEIKLGTPVCWDGQAGMRCLWIWFLLIELFNESKGLSNNIPVTDESIFLTRLFPFMVGWSFSW